MTELSAELRGRLDAAIQEIYRQRGKFVGQLIREVDGRQVVDCVCGHRVAVEDAFIVVPEEPNVGVVSQGGKIKALVNERISVICRKCNETYGGTWPLVVDFMKSVHEKKGGEAGKGNGSEVEKAKEVVE